METNSPSVSEWKKLYDAAIAFNDVGCWNWMYDSDIFGVQNALTSEIGYCCIMGMRKEHFALAVYLGTDGLAGYLKIQSGETSPDSPDALHVQKCLMASFEDRKYLHKKDLDVIKSLGLNFRGANSWPLFRSYLPGYHPWHLTSEEAKYLTTALCQAINVSLRFKANPKMFVSKNKYLVRVQMKDGEWGDILAEPPPLKKKELHPKPVGVKRLETINKVILQRQGIWETDFFYSPNAIQEKNERPHYPLTILWVTRHSNFILDCQLTESNPLDELPERFLKLTEKIKCLPKEIRVKKEEIFKILQPITSYLGITLTKVKKLEELEEAQAEMFDFFGQ